MPERPPAPLRTPGSPQPAPAGGSVADLLGPPLTRALGPVIERVAVTFWDGSSLLPDDAAVGIRVRSPVALRRLVWAPGELGLARGYVAGEIDLDGSVFDLLGHRDTLASSGGELSAGPATALRLAGAALRLGALGLPPPPPPEESRVRGRLHSKSRDRQAVTHHYDVGNDFFRLLLGPSLTYSCAWFARPGMALEEAQEAKYELVSAKLGLQPGMRLLDVGCGFGGMVLHAARHHGVSAVGVTLSPAQHALATQRVEDAGLGDRVEVRLADYRDVDDGPYDAVASIGMFEHVGLERMAEYFSRLRTLLAPGGRLLNHAISRPGTDSSIGRRSFLARYVFPDGELHDVGSVVSTMSGEGFEIRDVESLREHYARTTREWVANLEARWDEAVALVGKGRARIWRLYLAGSALSFDAGRIGVHQVLGVKARPDGSSGMPATREGWALSGR